MTMPQFRYIILPFLKHLSDGKEYSMKEIESALASEFKLTEEELSQTTPSGRMAIFSNRIGWSKTYLKKAGLVDSPRKSFVKITKQGIDVLSKNPKIIDTKFLNNFSSFREFQYGDDEGVSQVKEEISENTPEEIMEEGYQSILKNVQAELLTNLKNSSPTFFEQAVVDLLIAMGYGGSRKDAGQAIGKSGDEGIDGFIKEDKLGLDMIYIQAKRWENPVGRPEVHSFVGALSGKFSKKGILITTSRFTKEALSYVEKLEYKIILIDGWRLVQLMSEYNVGVSTVAKYEVKKIDTDYFTED